MKLRVGKVQNTKIHNARMCLKHIRVTIQQIRYELESARWYKRRKLERELAEWESAEREWESYLANLTAHWSD